MSWTQVYDPLHNWILSTLVAALPILVLFGLLAGLRVKPHWCAIAAAGTAVAVAVTVFGMPFPLAGMSFLYGVGFGVLKIAWIVLAAVYLYDISVSTGQFEIMKESVAGITADRLYFLVLALFDPAGHLALRRIRLLGYVTDTIDTWPKGQAMAERYRLVLPSTLPSGAYTLAATLSFRRGASTAYAVPDDPAVAAAGGFVTLGTVQVGP